MIVTVLDNTKIKEVKQTLKESEERFRNLIDFLPIIIYEVDITGKFVFANQQALNTFGLHDEIYDYKFNVFNVVIEEDRSRAMKVMQNIFSQK